MRQDVGRRRNAMSSRVRRAQTHRVWATLALGGGLLSTFGVPATAEPDPAPPLVSWSGLEAAAEPVVTTPRPAEQDLSDPPAPPDAPQPIPVDPPHSQPTSTTPQQPTSELSPEPTTAPSDSPTDASGVALPSPPPTTPSPTSSPTPSTERSPKPPATPSTKPSTTAEEKPTSPASRGARVLARAKALTGIPYVWGGTTTRGFDCSGFTQHVYAKVGVDLPRTAAQQQQTVRGIVDPQPGDLVFFGSPAHHVGIYAGEGRMYDAPRRGRATGLHPIWSRSVTYGRP